MGKMLFDKISDRHVITGLDEVARTLAVRPRFGCDGPAVAL